MRQVAFFCLSLFVLIGTAASDTSPDAKNLLTPSPYGPLQIYHEPYDFYVPGFPKPPMTFVVENTESHDVLKRIEVAYLGRYVDGLQWISNDYVLVKGEEWAILDVEQGVATEGIDGRRFALSPNHDKLIFRYRYVPRYGLDPGNPPPDIIGLAFEIEEDTKAIPWRVERIYPPEEIPEWQGPNASLPEERNRLRSSFSWSPSGHRVAFVEELATDYWLVVLDVSAVEAGHVPILRRPLPDFDEEEVRQVDWSEDMESVRIETDERSTWVDVRGEAFDQP